MPGQALPYAVQPGGIGRRVGVAAAASRALAVGLGFPSQYDDDKAFLDIARHMVRWKGNVSNAELDPADLDANGYPNKMPSGQTSVYTSFSITNGADPTLQGQRVVVTWDGDGVLAPGIALTYAAGESYSQGRIVVTPGAGNNQLSITSFGTTGVTNLSVVREAHEARKAAGELYNPDWLALLQGVYAVRFLNWSMNNNNLTLYTAANRPKLTSFTWRYGVPWEACIALANELGAHPWLPLPTRCTQDYVEAVAALTRDTLDTSLRATIEVSNETWNSVFKAFHHFNGRSAYLWGTALSGTVSVDAGSRTVTGSGIDFTAINFNDGAAYCFAEDGAALYGVAPSGLVVDGPTQLTLPAYKPADEALTGATVYRLAGANGSGAHNATSHDTRMVRQWWDAVHPNRTEFMLAGQSSTTVTLGERLAPSIWSAAANGGRGPNNYALAYAAPSTFIDAISTAPYFANSLTSGTEHEAVIAAYGTGTPAELSAAVDLTEQYFRTGLGNSLDNLIVKMREARAQADAAGVQFRLYEAGCHHIAGGLPEASEAPFAAIWTEWLATYGEAFFNDYFEAQASFADGGVMQYVISNKWGDVAVWGAYPTNYYAGDGRTAAMTTWKTKPQFWLPSVAPIATGGLPDITATEFGSVTIRLDEAFSSNAATFTATGLPSGLAVSGKTITGTLASGSAGSGTYEVTGMTVLGLPLPLQGNYVISAAPAVNFNTKTGGVFHFDATVGVTGGGGGDANNVTDWASGFGSVALAMANTAYPVTNVHTINGINSLRMSSSSPIQFQGPDITASFATGEVTVYAVVDLTDAAATTDRVIVDLFADNDFRLLAKPSDGTITWRIDNAVGLRETTVVGPTTGAVVIGARYDPATGSRLVVNGTEATDGTKGASVIAAGLLTVGGSASGFNALQLVRVGMLWAGAVADDDATMGAALAALTDRWT